MRISTTAILIAVAGLLSATNAFAQGPLGQPPLVSSAFEKYYDDEKDAPSASDTAAPEAAVDSSCGCDDGCGCDPNPWRLFPCLNRECGLFTLNGWVDTGATGNFQSPVDGYNGVQTFNDRNDLQFNQMYMVAEREANGDDGIGLGGRVDLMYGSDHRFTMARGLETNTDLSNKWNPDPALGGDGRFYGLAMPQMYADVALGGLNVRMGHFYTIIGYEVVTSPDNFFYSHAYTMQYGEPFTHTGMLVSGNLTDQIELIGGFHRGWDNWESAGSNDTLSYLGGATWTSCDESTTLAFAMTTGLEPATGVGPRGAHFANRTMYSIVFSTELPSGVKYVFQHDYGKQQEGATGAAGSLDAEWYGVNQYLMYELNDCVSIGGRFEWFRDDDGTRVGRVGFANNPAVIGGFAGNFYGYTFGLNVKPNDNVVIRPELRFDNYDGPSGTAGLLPYDGGDSTYQTTIGVDAIVLW